MVKGTENIDWTALSKCERLDLACIGRMMEMGYEVKIDPRDILAQRTTPENIPLHPISFTKGNEAIWQCIGTYNKVYGIYWRQAFLVNGYWAKHKTLGDLPWPHEEQQNKKS